MIEVRQLHNAGFPHRNVWSNLSHRIHDTIANDIMFIQDFSYLVSNCSLVHALGPSFGAVPAKA